MSRQMYRHVRRDKIRNKDIRDKVEMAPMKEKNKGGETKMI